VKGWYQNDNENHLEGYVNALGSQSFQCIFVGQLEKAEQYAREALSIDPTQHWINTNLASSLLFQGRYAEAEAIYRQYKDELKDSFLGDFEEFEKSGVIPEERKADVERIRKMLNE
jgi:tetratricopeptide (TPR) repeat protein